VEQYLFQIKSRNKSRFIHGMMGSIDTEKPRKYFFGF